MDVRDMRFRVCLAAFIGLWPLFFCPEAPAARIKDICDIQGARPHILKGTGLVVGLAGSGDKAAEAVRAQARMLDRLDIDVVSEKGLTSDNVAVVVVSAETPAFAKEGTRIDVTISSIYDCKSLEGGTLLETFLYAIDGQPYAIAQGPVSVGGFSAGAGGGAQVRQNHLTVGRIPQGAYIEREIPSTITDGERLTLQLKRPDFTTANNIQEAVNAALGEEAATAFGAGAVNVKIPEFWRPQLVSFVAHLQDISVELDVPARVVINERTGTIVVGGDVRIKPCQVAHGNLSITVSVTPIVSQPLPLSGGETVVTQETQVRATPSEAYLMPVEGASAADVASALNKLKVTPRDMIAIFQAIRHAGALEAELEIM